MKRFRHWVAIVGLCAATAAGCSNYRDDLDRAASHYNRNQYENALALLQPLELDLDSLSEQERAQYAYYRGMSHFRLNQRRDARHWPDRPEARPPGPGHASDFSANSL